METGITPPWFKDFVKETGATFSWNEDFYTKTGHPILKQTNLKTSKEGIPSSKETVHGSGKTLLKDNYDSLNDTAPFSAPVHPSKDHRKY